MSTTLPHEVSEWLSNLDDEELCRICCYAATGCPKHAVFTPDGPVYPVCTYTDPVAIVDYEAAINAYHDVFCSDCTSRVCDGCEHQHES